MFLESVILPIPSEVVLPFTGFLIAINKMNPVLGFGDAVVASLLGSLVGYLLGYFLGVDIFLRYSKRIGFGEEEYKKGIVWIKRYGNYFTWYGQYHRLKKHQYKNCNVAVVCDEKYYLVKAEQHVNPSL